MTSVLKDLEKNVRQATANLEKFKELEKSKRDEKILKSRFWTKGQWHVTTVNPHWDFVTLESSDFREISNQYTLMDRSVEIQEGVKFRVVGNNVLLQVNWDIAERFVTEHGLTLRDTTRRGETPLEVEIRKSRRVAKEYTELADKLERLLRLVDRT